MPVHPYINPGRMSKEPLFQESLLLIGVPPFVSCFIVLGLVLLSSGIPSLLLLRAAGESPALDLLRAYRTGLLLTCALMVLAPFLFAALDVLLFCVFRRKRDAVTAMLSIPAFTLLSSIMLVLIVIVAWGGGLWRAELPEIWGQYNADVRQIEAGELEHMTLLLDEKSTPNSLPGAPSDELTVHHRGASGPDTDFKWMTLRFPDALGFEPVPDSFVVIGKTCAWNWEHQQRYEVFFTSELRLVDAIVPVS